MEHKYDFYANFQIRSKEDVDNIVSGYGRYSEITDVLSRILLLNTALGLDLKFSDRRGRPNRIEPKDYAKVGEGDYSSGLKAIIHSSGALNAAIECSISLLTSIGINIGPDISTLPYGSWIIEFPLTLATPYISKDDVPLYIIDNPLRKDKVFGVPFTSAQSWKGNLKWTMMKIYLDPVTDPDEFAETRFRHFLLFGAEKGTEDTPKGWAKYLDSLCPDAAQIFQDMVNERVGESVHVQGMLHFYPTFWDRVDMIVINPHDRRTKTGKKPIYFEVVPEGSKGFFRLLYVPYYWINKSKSEILGESLRDLSEVVQGLENMMLRCGFSAKKSSGYGIIEDSWDKGSSRLEVVGLGQTKFGNFEEMLTEVSKLMEGISNE